MADELMINFSVDSEILSKDELAEMTGLVQRSKQLEYLRSRGWKHDINSAGDPIVGRWYARLKLAGVDVSSSSGQVRMPDFSKVA